MALTTTKLTRKITYKGNRLDDIEGASMKDIAKAYSGIYPELLNSTPTYKGIEDGEEVYEFSTASVGVKG